MMAKVYTQLERNRLDKIERLKAQGIDPYPHRVERTHANQQAILEFEAGEAEGTLESDPVWVTVVGRLRALRQMGKISFAHIEDGSGRLQLFMRVNDLGEETMTLFNREFDLGDFLQASGEMFRTRSGEVTLRVKNIRMLAKAVTPLPADKDEIVEGEVVRHALLSDPETRYRQRYADLAVNPDVRDVFRARARIIRSLRQFMDDHGFLEVETPILQPLYGGAAARPFITHHNQLHQDLYLRISFELYLKRLLVGGYERVYEIGRDFRNEGVSFKHNPEFTQMEFYWAYADYKAVMALTEEMLRFVAMQVLGQTTFNYQGNEIDLGRPWLRIELREALLDATGIDIDAHPTQAGLLAAMRVKGYNPDPDAPRGKLIEGMLGDFVEPNLIQPTFMYDYPRDISPLAKSKPGDPTIVERFEGFLGGMELLNAFTELNDPLDQEARFLEMAQAFDIDDEELHPIDEDYLRAMRYGMPPNGGFGMGVDRLTMLLTDQPNIREVILFPHLRERED